ncbi:MAG: MFS transporter [Thaumarchaeota archaeon]|nr:MFS transporter [Nitrososphaerota archaeon]
MRPRLSGNLWHNQDFSRLWFAETISSFGNQFSVFALPVLAILSFDATPFDIGLIGALAILPYPLLGLFVGVWVDRIRKRRVMVLCNLGRMATLASIPVASVLGLLTLTQLFVVALIVGIFSVCFDTCYQSILPILVERKDLIEGNQKLQITASGASVAGPALAGFIYHLIGGALTCAVDAFGYLTASVALFNMNKEEPKKVRVEGSPPPHFFNEMREGIHVTFGNPILRSIAAATATNNLGSSMIAPVLTIFALRYLHYSTVELGFLGTIGAFGFVLGALSSSRVTARLGTGRGLAVSISLGATAILYPLAMYGFPFVLPATVAFIIGLSSPIYNITQVSLRQAITPDRLQGRMNATIRVIIMGAVPVGSFAGGILGVTIGVTDTMYLGGAIAGFAVLWIVSGPLLGLKHPDPAIEEIRP